MPKSLSIFCMFILLSSTVSFAQNVDSAINALQKLPAKYATAIDHKIEKYSSRVKDKTEKTLTKLSRWENKIHSILQKANPAAAEKLFGNGQLTFTSLLQKIKQGEAITLEYQAQYDKYRDDLTSSLNYLSQQKEELEEKVTRKLAVEKEKMEQFNGFADSTEALEQFIKERKKELINTAFQYLGNNKYLGKINKEVWYYAETIKNYKEIFSDENKMEQTTKAILNRIPAFRKFAQENSMINSLFGQPGDMVDASGISGLQTRAGIGQLIQERIAAGGPNAMEQVQQNIQMGRGELSKLKDKILKSPTFGNGGETLPDFKVNPEKVKTFQQRLEYNTNLQFAKNNNLMPTTADIAFGVGYRLSEKSLAGIQVGYKLGMGSIERIRFSNQGISLRSFLDWKLKGQFFISGGMEINYLSDLPTANTVIKYDNAWQKSALAGLSKKIKMKTKLFKETKLSLLYDFLADQHLPRTTSILFRVGYNF